MPVLPSEPEFEQAYNELVSTLKNSSLFDKQPELRTALKVVSIPERVIQFRVVWTDDRGELQVNRGYRVQFNSALGPYKGGLRLHPSVNLSILKFLGFEQVFKNALTGLQMGGGKGGADFDPKGKSDAEIRRFCEAFMAELSRHIGALTDVPAGDMGVGGREIGFLFGAYRRLRNRFEGGVLTGKGLDWGGSLIRPEATGYGLVYYVSHMLGHAGAPGWAGRRVAVSGSGNVAQYAALKVMELGGTVVSLSDSRGALVARGAKGGVSRADVEAVMALKERRRPLSELPGCGGSNGVANGHKGANGHANGNGVNGNGNGVNGNGVNGNGVNGNGVNGNGVNGNGVNGHSNGTNGHSNGHEEKEEEEEAHPRLEYMAGARPWAHVGRVDVALPCATQNELSGAEAEALVAAGVRFVAEGSNMGCEQAAIDVFEAHRRANPAAAAVWYAPGKAANCGGVAVSGLEMGQNSSRLAWPAEKVDKELQSIMENAFQTGLKTAKEYVPAREGELPSLVAGSNIAGFVKVARAMHDQGDWW
ncbi:NADP-specific glutamate dehydrogenase [Gaeumannomyces tritici R3-111a-1]|uniref:Glutamate dehydrogenase n=1 Tax=Gaeumannomyces tritici (strain R3-111a-1) TaxID=644352 RepID=J3P026_GAET3|nr:NADP-specific glutamate dehydrogenase [Gaeumannomyces tritici R3-111a-1]EJT76959.1 NADP-specific glutamate dehydrogenase [Gaeumannomyces tritici R3-111a-1]